MMTELCLYLHNWFDRDQPHYFGEFTISNGALVGDMLVANQYYRIIGSKFNDGVYKHGSETLIDETFDGAIWMMAVPPDVVGISVEIAAWQAKYGGVDSENMSPFTSESFGGYSYSKAGSGDSAVPTWQNVFANRLRGYKKI